PALRPYTCAMTMTVRAELVKYGALCIFFFFQAEDGIRDFHVTGVQTCALPISTGNNRSESTATTSASAEIVARAASTPPRSRPRSEERRVGKEWRSRWSPEQQKKKDGTCR